MEIATREQLNRLNRAGTATSAFDLMYQVIHMAYHERAPQSLENAALVPAQVLGLSNLNSTLVHHLHCEQLP